MLMAPALVTVRIIFSSGALVTMDKLPAIQLALGKALSAVLTFVFLLVSHKYHPSFFQHKIYHQLSTPLICIEVSSIYTLIKNFIEKF